MKGDLMKKIKDMPKIDVQFQRKAGLGLEPVTDYALFIVELPTHSLPHKTVERLKKAFWKYRDAVREMDALNERALLDEAEA